MGSRSWAASGRPRGGASTSGPRPRPAGSWLASIARARDAWDDLTGDSGRLVVDMSLCDCGTSTRPHVAGAPAPEHQADCAGWVSIAGYTDAAAAAILDTALRLWADTAASMGEDPPED